MQAPTLTLALLLTLTTATHAAPTPVMLLSIDGLHPDQVLDAEHRGLPLQHLRRLLQDGAHARITPALPAITYPNHTTMVTGVSPARHGILSNHPFDPAGKNQGGWYWYAEDIHAPTLWDAAARAGLKVAAVDWPVTVGAHIPLLIPQYWRADTPDDHKLLRALATPGLLDEAEHAVGPYPSGYNYSIEADRRRAATATFLWAQKHPRLLLCYFGSLDEEQHRSGPDSPAALRILGQIDGLVGDLRAAAEQAGGGQAFMAVVSDHGFARYDRVARLNAALRQAGLIERDPGGPLKSFRAMAWGVGGSAALVLRDPADREALSKARQVLGALAGPEGPIASLEEPPHVRRPPAGAPHVALWVLLREGVVLDQGLDGPITEPARRGGGHHGYSPQSPTMDAVLLLAGPGVPAGEDLGRIDMRDVAPTLAGALGVQLRGAEGQDRLRPGK